nr:peptidoglycan-binding domain-containing protein [Sinorhizobium medicae]
MGGPGASFLLGHPGSEPTGRRGRRRDDHEEDRAARTASPIGSTGWRGSRSSSSAAADNVLQFQADQRLQVDGDVGPKTRAALHTALGCAHSGRSGTAGGGSGAGDREKAGTDHAAQPRRALVEVERVPRRLSSAAAPRCSPRSAAYRGKTFS